MREEECLNKCKHAFLHSSLQSVEVDVFGCEYERNEEGTRQRCEAIKGEKLKGGDGRAAPVDLFGSKVCWIISDSPTIKQKLNILKQLFEYIF